MLGAKKATDSTALALRRLVKVKPLAGYTGLEKRKTVRPAVGEMNVHAHSHTSGRPLDCHDAKEKALRRRFLFFLRKKLFSRSLSVDEVLINRHQHARYVLEPALGR